MLKEKLQQDIKDALKSGDGKKRMLLGMVLAAIKNKEIETNKIGEFIMNKLKKTDKIAYIRFASVYKDFQDAGDFKMVLKEI